MPQEGPSAALASHIGRLEGYARAVSVGKLFFGVAGADSEDCISMVSLGGYGGDSETPPGDMLRVSPFGDAELVPEFCSLSGDLAHARLIAPTSD